MLVSLESTTYPGTTEGEVRNILESGGLRCGSDFFLVHSPERVDPGSREFNTRNTPKIVGGVEPNSLEVGMEFYKRVVNFAVPVSSCRTAELVKVFENTFRAVNIGLVNEMACICETLDIDVWEMLKAANTKPFGIMPFYPGPGVGGHCIPIDPHYLDWKMQEFGTPARFVRLASEVNRSMPAYVVSRISRMLNDAGLAVRESRILVLGVAYKPDVSDCRESPVVDVVRGLINMGADIKYHDPFVPTLEKLNLSSVDLTESDLAGSDIVVVGTAHSNFDPDYIARNAVRVFDTRNMAARLPAKPSHWTLL
jgi:UDP-N-acetyl-D-glucosamine dehydrogenase